MLYYVTFHAESKVDGQPYKLLTFINARSNSDLVKKADKIISLIEKETLYKVYDKQHNTKVYTYECNSRGGYADKPINAKTYLSTVGKRVNAKLYPVMVNQLNLF